MAQTRKGKTRKKRLKRRRRIRTGVDFTRLSEKGRIIHWF